MIRPNTRWQKLAIGNGDDVEDALDDHAGPLWVNGRSSFGYSNNRLSEEEADQFDYSLVLIRPSRLRIAVGRKGGVFPGSDDRLVKAYFTHNRIDYTLAVTDPGIKKAFLAGQDRVEDMTGAVICVSLGEIYKGNAYKLVASVIEV